MPQLRLAFREEGRFWNAYIAAENTMEGAQLLGSIAIGSAKHPDIKRGFIELMKVALEEALHAVTGARPADWTEKEGPLPERSRNN